MSGQVDQKNPHQQRAGEAPGTPPGTQGAACATPAGAAAGAGGGSSRSGAQARRVRRAAALCCGHVARVVAGAVIVPGDGGKSREKKTQLGVWYTQAGTVCSMATSKFNLMQDITTCLQLEVSSSWRTKSSRTGQPEAARGQAAKLGRQTTPWARPGGKPPHTTLAARHPQLETTPRPRSGSESPTVS